MLIGTHALSPVVISVFGGALLKYPLKGREFVLIACMGAAPDLLNPHLSLAARHSSWSHSLVGFAVVIGSFFVVAGLIRKVRVRVLCWSAFAYLWHLTCDWFSGGIPYLYPIRKDLIGGGWLSSAYWLYADAFFILLSIMIWKYKSLVSHQKSA